MSIFTIRNSIKRWFEQTIFNSPAIVNALSLAESNGQTTTLTMKENKIHTTNYFDTFIEVAEDTKVSYGTKPTSKADKKTIAEMQYEMLVNNPYKFTSDDILFQVFADRNDLTKAEYKQARQQFFSKGQPCLRSSPLTKTYGYGVHADSNGKVAIFGMETEQYEKFQKDPKLKKTKAMRTSKK